MTNSKDTRPGAWMESQTVLVSPDIEDTRGALTDEREAFAKFRRTHEFWDAGNHHGWEGVAWAAWQKRAAIAASAQQVSPQEPVALTDEPRRVIALLLNAMNWWGAQEDGIPEDCSGAVETARNLLAAPSAPSPTVAGMTDGAIREIVNQLRDISIVYHNTQQLRARIANLIVPHLKGASSDSAETRHSGCPCAPDGDGTDSKCPDESGRVLCAPKQPSGLAEEINEWVAKFGNEDTATFLLCRAAKALAAPAATRAQWAVTLNEKVRKEIEGIARHPYDGAFAVYLTRDDARAILAAPAQGSDARDAARYRWLRENVHNELSLWDVRGPNEFTMGVDDLNTAIDAAMSREQPTEQPTEQPKGGE